MISEPGLSKTASLERLKAAGMRPATVFDVGVAKGTRDLYGVFEDVRYALIDPLDESLPFMEAWRARYPGSVAVLAAAGPKSGETSFIVSPNMSGSSILLKPKHGTKRTVKMVTLDEVAAEHGLVGPHLVKIDVQGYELEVLAGAEAVLRDTCALIVEVSLWADVKGKDMAQIVPLMAWLAQRGMALYDIAAIVRRDFDGAITEMDLVFVPAGSPLRADTRYKLTADQDGIVAERRKGFGLS